VLLALEFRLFYTKLTPFPIDPMNTNLYSICLFLLALCFSGNVIAQNAVIRSYDFENGPAGFQFQTAGAANDGWFVGNAAAAAGQNFVVPEHTNFIFTSDRKCTPSCNKSQEIMFFDPNNGVQFDIPNVVLEFDCFFKGETQGPTGEAASVLISNNGQNYNVLQAIPGNNAWQTIRIPLESYRTQALWFGFFYNDNNGAWGGLAIDNVRIYTRTLGRNLWFQQFQNLFEFTDNDALPIRGIVYNTGSEDVTSFDFSYTINGGDPVTFAFSDLDFKPGSGLQIIHGTPAATQESGKYNVEAWVHNANKIERDSDTSDDTLSGNIQVVTERVSRRTLAERFTSRVCGPCPVAEVTLNRLISSAADSLISVNYHIQMGEQLDPMSNAASTDWLNRVSQLSGGTVELMSFSLDRRNTVPFNATENIWRFLSQETAAPLSLDWDRERSTFNPESNILYLSLSTNSVADLSEYPTLKTTAIVVEETVQGPRSSNYDQANAANADPAFAELFEKGDPFARYAHSRVFRSFGTDVNGIPLEIDDDTLTAGDSHEWVVAVPLPSGMNPDLARIVLFVGGFQNDNPVLQNVFNSLEIRLSDVTPNSLAEGLKSEMKSLTIWPNPTESSVQVSTPYASSYQLEICDLAGRELRSPELFTGEKYIFDVQDLPKGIYILRLVDQSTGQQWQQKLVRI